MQYYFSDQVLLYWNDYNITGMVTVYRRASGIPSTTAFAKLADRSGFVVNKDVKVGGATNIFAAFKHSIPYVAKLVCSDEEEDRINAYLQLDLHHPNIVNMEILINRFENGKVLIGMPRMTASLAEAHCRALALPHITKIIADLLPALKYLHANGVAHMDMKPSNVGIDPQGNHVLIDLGSAASFSVATSVTTQFLPTEAGDFGELASDPQWDFWGLGVMLVRLRNSITPKHRPTKDQVYQFLKDMQVKKKEALLAELYKSLPEKSVHIY